MVWLSEKLQWQVDFLENHKCDAVHGNIQIIDASGKIINRDKWESENDSRRKIDWLKLSKIELSNKILLKPNIRIISSMVSRNLFESIDGFKEQFFGGEDELFWFEVIRNGTLGYINKVLFLRREHESNTFRLYSTHRLHGYYNAINFIRRRYPNENQVIIERKRKEKLFALFRQSLIQKQFYYTFYSFFLLLFRFPLYFLKEIKIKLS